MLTSLVDLEQCEKAVRRRVERSRLHSVTVVESLRKPSYIVFAYGVSERQV